MTEILGIYTNEAGLIFVASRSNLVTNMVIFVLVVGSCVAIGYLFNKRYFDYEEYKLKMEELHKN